MDLTATLEYKIEEVKNAKDLIESSRSRHPIRDNLLESMETHISVLEAILPHTRAAELPDDVQVIHTPIEGLDHVVLGRLLEILADGDEIPILKEDRDGRDE